MSTFLLFLLGIFYIIISILMCIQESKTRKISLPVALVLCLLITPFFAYFIFGLMPARYPKGCKWCGNKKNEAAYCGLCGKNEAGETRTTLL